MKYLTRALALAASAYASIAMADDDLHEDHHYSEEIIVSAPFNQKEADTALPINILTDEQLAREVEDTDRKSVV